MKAFEVTLPTTNGMRDTYRHNEGYIHVHHGKLIVVAESIKDVGEKFNDAEEIKEIGIGFVVANSPTKP